MEVNLNVTSAFDKHISSSNRFCISQGGGRAGKTIAILQCLILKCLENPNSGLIISVVAETYPFLKRGALRDFEMIMTQAGLWDRSKFNKTESKYNLMGNTIEFFSVETYTKALGAARDILFLNEANNIRYETAFQLISRTKKKIYIDFNPVSEFWAHTEIMQNEKFQGKFDFFITTFLDNEFLEEEIKETMLARAAKDENYEKVYVKGQIGTVEGLIYKKFIIIDEIPEEIKNKARKQYIGLDWGWDDVTAGLSGYILGTIKQPVTDIYLNEFLYLGELKNRQIGKYIKENVETRNYEVIADSSEPKSIDELFSMSLNIKGVEKPPGSVNFGIELLQQSNIYVTRDSLNLIKELRNYKWAEDKEGKIIRDKAGRPVPIDLWNHLLDSARYIAFTHHNLKYNYRSVPRGTKGLKPV